MNILFTAFECVPFAKVGGLADVAGTLPKYLKKKNDVRIILPLHKKVDRDKFKIKYTGKAFNVTSTEVLKKQRYAAQSQATLPFTS